MTRTETTELEKPTRYKVAAVCIDSEGNRHFVGLSRRRL